MKTQQLVGGPTAWANSYIGPERELTVDTDRKELRIHDGVTPGGLRILNESQLQAYASLEFTAVHQAGLTQNTNLSAFHVRRLVNASAVGGPWKLRLPQLSLLDIGATALIRADTPDVQLIPYPGEGWINGTADETDFVYAMPAKQVIKMAKFSPTRWIVTSIR